MKFSLAYMGQSRMISSETGEFLTFAPNLTREQVSFNAALKQPLRFREGISALHDIVINDLRFQRRDKSGYEQWKKGELSQERAVYQHELTRNKRELAALRGIELPPDFEKTFETTRKRYWGARNTLTRILIRENPKLWRMLMPCDPVITVAPDVLLYECFSADESSYGCLSVSREAYGEDGSSRLGTTNVDYSWDLYHQFQKLRTYRETRFSIDPTGFEVKHDESPEYREEKINLPPGWLRGFMTTQEAMGMPGITVSISREAVYSALAFLKRHKARTSPRAIRFDLQPGKPPKIILEPWEQEIVSHGTRYDGPSTEAIRIWGARRLLTLGRTLPLAERYDVRLLGTGLPSFWICRMGEMNLTLGLSGWTTNDWTRGSSLDLLAPPASIREELITNVAKLLESKWSLTQTELQSATGASGPAVMTALRRLAFAGQVIHDLPNGVYRYRQVMPMPLEVSDLGPENEEMTAARELLLRSSSQVEEVQRIERNYLMAGNIGSTPVELIVDADGRIRRGKCMCGHFRQFGIRKGPCRHMIALRSLSRLPELSSLIASSGSETTN